MNIPGVPVIHKVVTKQCRERPIEDIKKETIDELWASYLRCIEGWPKTGSDSEAKFHFALMVERPK